MKCWPDNNRRRSGFTFIDLMILLATVLLLFGVVFHLLTRPRTTSSRISCINNLKQTGFAFVMWVLDNDGELSPMSLSTNEGGTKELISAGETYRHFLAMGPYLRSPTCLVCPWDKNRTRVSVFATNFAQFNNSNVSYFVGLDADQTNPNMLLTGDRNLTNTILPKGPIMTLNRQSQVGWTRDLHSAKSKEPCGNIGFADGSASQLTTLKLREALGKSTNGMQRIMLP